jgi:hypothetical protein
MPRTKKEAATAQKVVEVFKSLPLDEKVAAFKDMKADLEKEKQDANENLKLLTEAVK